MNSIYQFRNQKQWEQILVKESQLICLLLLKHMLFFLLLVSKLATRNSFKILSLCYLMVSLETFNVNGMSALWNILTY